METECASCEPTQCGILNISQPYRPPRPVRGMALHFLNSHMMRYRKIFLPLARQPTHGIFQKKFIRKNILKLWTSVDERFNLPHCHSPCSKSLIIWMACLRVVDVLICSALVQSISRSQQEEMGGGVLSQPCRAHTKGRRFTFGCRS
jgi:hypothetical protein